MTGPVKSARALWSALAGVGLALLVCGVTAHRRIDPPRTPGSPAPSWPPASATSPMARSALPDLPLAFCITLTIVAAFAGLRCRRCVPPPSLRWWASPASRRRPGVPDERPRGRGRAGRSPWCPAWWLERRAAARATGDTWRAAAAIGCRHRAAVVRRDGRDATACAYLESFFVGDNLERFATTASTTRGRSGSTRRSSPAACCRGRRTVSRRPAPGSPRSRAGSGTRPRRDAPAVLGHGPALFFTASVGQQPRYVLPVLPPLAILMARAIGDRVDAARALGRRRRCSAARRGRPRPLFVGALPCSTVSSRSSRRPPAIADHFRRRHGGRWAALASSRCGRRGVAPGGSGDARARRPSCGLQFSVLAAGRPEAGAADGRRSCRAPRTASRSAPTGCSSATWSSTPA